MKHDIRFDPAVAAIPDFKPEPQCKTCQHPKLTEINDELLAGEMQKDIAERYGLSIYSVHRHNVRHLQPAIYRAYKRHVEIYGELSEGEIIGDLDASRRALRNLAHKGVEPAKNAGAQNSLSKTLLQTMGVLGGDGVNVNVAVGIEVQAVAPMATALVEAFSDQPETQDRLIEFFSTYQIEAPPPLEPRPEMTPGAQRILEHIATIEDAEVVEERSTDLPDW